MEEVIHVASGLLKFSIVHGLLAFGALRAASVWPSLPSPLDRLLAAITVAASQSVAVTLALAAFGLLNPYSIGITSILISLAILLATRRLPRTPFLKTLLSGFSSSLAKHPLLLIAFLPGAAFFLLLFLHAIPRPPLGYDPLNYHLTIAYTAAQTGSFWPLFFPPYFDLYAWFPANRAVFILWAIFWTGCDLFLPLINLPFLLMLAISLYSLARSLGATRALSAATTSALMTAPMMAMLATEAYCEVPLWAFFFTALRFAYLARQDPRHLFLCGSLCGLMMGTKTVGFLLAAIVLAFEALTYRAPFKDLLRHTYRLSLALLVGFATLGSFFYIRNLILSGNPIYPVPVAIGLVEVFHGHPDLGSRLAATSALAHFDYLWQSGKLSHALLGDVFTFHSSWGLGPYCLSALPLGLILALFSPKRSSLGLVLCGLALIAAWLAMPYSGKFIFPNVRFAWPGFAFLALTWAKEASRRWEPFEPFLVGATLFLQGASFYYSHITVTSGMGLFLVYGSACLLLLALLAGPKRPLALWPSSAGPIRKGLLIVASSFLALTLILLLHHHREENRIRYYREADEPFRIQLSTYADCLRALETHLPRGRLAVALEPYRRGFLAPLFGSHLTRVVFYVHNGPEDSRLHPDYPYGNPRLHPDKAAWLRHLAESRADALLSFPDYLENEIPIESEWAKSLPKVFRLVYSDDRCDLFLIDREALEAQGAASTF